jgi:hypothetical protein
MVLSSKSLFPSVPPHLDDTDHTQRCLLQLRSKNTALEKYIYLNALKDRDQALFYQLLLGNMLVCAAFRQRGRSLTSDVTGNSADLVYAYGKSGRVSRWFDDTQPRGSKGRRCLLELFAYLAAPRGFVCFYRAQGTY